SISKSKSSIIQEPYLRESHNKMLSLINLKLLYMALKRKVPQGIIHPLSKVSANFHFLLIPL
ncbi:MAG: hypothetical protein IJY83_08900, partial [Oscillospiraceae bacterium]|nr:hypothetical protein [Oscillospiraceae bacterium]